MPIQAALTLKGALHQDALDRSSQHDATLLCIADTRKHRTREIYILLMRALLNGKAQLQQPN